MPQRLTMEYPKVTIGIVNSRTEWLYIAKGSAERQFYAEFAEQEVIVIDNLKRDKSIGYCYNEIAKKATGKWILYLGDDDYITSDYVISLILRAIDAEKANPDKKIVNVISFTTIFNTIKKEVSSKSPTGMWLREYVLNNSFNEILEKYVDTEMFRRLNLSKEYFPAIASNQYGYYYRQHDNNVSGNKFDRNDYDAVRTVSHKITKINENYLNKLLPILRDPIDKTKLTPVINKNSLDGFVSENGSAYNVNDGIPIMMVDLSEYGDWNDMWEELQSEEFRDYLQSPEGIFSTENNIVALKIHDIIINYISGNCLDIGCGALARPSYMNKFINWFGTDPYYGNAKREFPFVQGVAEYLPFADKSFDNVFMGTSIDHFLNPEKAILEARRVLKDNGKILIWYAERTGKLYDEWLKNGGMYNKHHKWAWNNNSLKELVESCGFKTLTIDKLNDTVSYLFYGGTK